LLALRTSLLLPAVRMLALQVGLQQGNRLFVILTFAQQLQQRVEVQLIELASLEPSRKYFPVDIARIVVQRHADIFALDGGSLPAARSVPGFSRIHAGKHSFEQRNTAEQGHQATNERQHGGKHRRQPVRPPRYHQRQQHGREQDRDHLPVNPGRLARQPAKNDEQCGRQAD
jgi:hypothetical protein